MSVETKTVEIIIKGQQANASLREIQSASRVLNAELKKLPVNSQEFIDKTKELQEVNKRLKSINDDVKGVGGVFGQISKEVKAFGLVAMGALGFEFLKNKVSDIIGQNAKLSDSFAEIQRTTGMTEAEVNRLNKAFGQMNTRTSTADLREIAAAAGQLGVSKKDILSFTEATDKLVVAFGSEFSGGAEEVTNVIGKLRNNFSDIKSDNISEDMMHIGNAISALASDGLATAPVVADFANRIGGVGINLGLTSGQVLGLSATLQELGVSTERGGTAITKMLTKMANNAETFARVAGKDVKEFTKTINTDLYGAFIQVVEGSRRGGASATEFAAILDGLGVDGAGASEVFSKLGNNIGMLQNKTAGATGKLKEMDNITGSFALKNETLGAKVDKLGKQVAAVFTSETFNRWVASGIDGLTRFVEWLRALPDVISKNISALVAISTAVAVYNGNLIKSKGIMLLDLAAKKLGIETTVVLDGVTRRATVTEIASNVAKRASTVTQSIWNGLQAAGAAITGVFTGTVTLSTVATKIATAAQWAWNAAMEANPIGLVIGLIGGLVAGVMKVSEVMAANKEIMRKAFADEAVRSSNKEMVVTKAIMGDIYKLTMSQVKLREKEIEKRLAGAKAQYEEARTNKAIGAEELQRIADNYKTTLSLKTSLLTRKTQLMQAEIDAEKLKNDAVVTLTKEELKAKQDALDELLKAHIKLQDDIGKLELEEYNRGLSKDQLELALIDQKYAKLIRKEEGFEKENNKLKMLWASERIDAEAKQKDEKDKKEKEKAEKLAAEKIKIEDEVFLATINANDREKVAIMQKYDALILAAEKHGIDTKGLKAAQKREIEELVKAQADKEIEIEKEKVKKIGEENKKLIAIRLKATEDFINGLSKLYAAFETSQKIKDDAELKRNDTNLEQRLAANDAMLKAGERSQTEHDKRADSLKKEHDKKEKKIQHDQFERERKGKIAAALIDGAMGSAQIWGQWAAYPYVAGALQAIEAAAVMLAVSNISEEANPYAKGGYNRTSDDPQGYTTGATLYTRSASGKAFIAGEAGMEWISPSWMLSDPETAPMIQTLEMIRQAKTYATGGGTGSGMATTAPTYKSTVTVNMDKVEAVLDRLVMVLDGGIDARLDYDNFIRGFKKIDGAINAAKIG